MDSASGLKSFGDSFHALVVGATGGIGGALLAALDKDPRCAEVHRMDRSSHPGFDLLDERSIEKCAEQLSGDRQKFSLIIDATGALEIDGAGPEKSLKMITAETMSKAFRINAVGPALLIKYLVPLMPKTGKTVFATLSARVGSISDNEIGGWVSYRASKAALNQIVKTAAIEFARSRPSLLCVALQPGTVLTPLSERYVGKRSAFTPKESASKLLTVIDELDTDANGGFFDHASQRVPW